MTKNKNIFNKRHIFNLNGEAFFDSFEDYRNTRKNQIPTRFKGNIIKNGKASKQISKKLLDMLNKIYNENDKKTGFFFYGISGGGKTHNLWLISLVLMSDLFQRDSILLNTIRMIDIIYQSKINKDDAEYTIDDVRKYPGTLMLDEFGEDFETSASLRVVKDIIDYRYSNKLFTLFASNLSIKDIAEKYDDRLSNRIQEMCYEIEIPKREIKNKK